MLEPRFADGDELPFGQGQIESNRQARFLEGLRRRIAGSLRKFN